MFDTAHFSNAKKYWHRGKLHDWSEADLHPMTFALHYGGSVFEGIRAYKTPKGPAIFRLSEHIDRFLHSASVARMKVPYTKQEIIEAIKVTMKANRLESAYIRPILYYSYGNLGLTPKYCPVDMAIGIWEWGLYLGAKTEKGVSAYILPWRRIHHSQLDTTAKLGGLYVQSTICALDAHALGFDEGIFLNLEGNIAEGAGENIFIVKDNVLKTNDNKQSILEGITRTTILEIAGDLGLKAVVGPITKEEFLATDEAFFSGTAVEIASIIKITDGSNSGSSKTKHSIGSGRAGAVTLQLRKLYKEIVTGKTKKYEPWLTYVKY